MLKTLKIKNVALIQDAQIEFSNNLNIISGETGAGKSVLLDAIMLILGARAEKGLIKSGEDFLRVEATFVDNDNENINKFFVENDIDYDDCIIIGRKITNEGKNEIKINGQNVPLSFLKQLGTLLIDVHLQNESNEILSKNKQLQLIDGFGNVDLSGVQALFEQLKEINESLEQLCSDDDSRQRELELLNFQIKEIEDSKISSAEEEELQNEFLMLKNSEKIQGYIDEIKYLFVDNSNSVEYSLKKAINNLESLKRFNDKAYNLQERLSNATIEIEDVYDEILKDFDCEFNEQRYNYIDERLDLYKRLHKKYGQSFNDIVEFLDNSKKRREKLENAEEELRVLNDKKNKLLKDAYNECDRVSKIRRQTAHSLVEKVLCELRELSMPSAKLSFKFKEVTFGDFEDNFTKSGFDTVNLFFSANLGEEEKPIDQVASGGEISRLLLAIKTVTSQKTENITMIFDEIDTGISGEASVSTSKKLAKIALNHQVIAISHLFQICAMADENILVKKVEENGKTFSKPMVLDSGDAVAELCRFLSVGEVTESTKTHALEVKKYCDEYKKEIRKNSKN